MNQTDPSGPPRAGPVDRQRMMAEAIDLHRRGRFVEAERIYRRILQTEPNHPDALHLLGLIAREAGQTEAAIQLIQRAIAISPDTASFRSNLAMIYEQEGRYEDCELAARGALESNPDDGNALHCLANALRATDRHQEAAGIYAAAVKILSGDPSLWSNYGATLQTLGRADEAIPMLERAVELSPGRAELHSNLGNARLAAGQADAAVKSYRDALRLDPNFAPAYTNLANALMQAGENREAEDVLQRCLEVRPGDCKALAYLAAAAGETGDLATRDRLMDFDHLMADRRLPVPEGYECLEAFNRALVDHVTRHGTRKWEPVTKTTRRGSQTGELLDESPGPVAALEQMVREAVVDYLAAIPDEADHPFLATAPEEWRLTMWATILEEGGHQAAHLHPTGWLSGVYYAAVPEAATDEEQAGWIEFGRPPDNFRMSRPAATRLIEPEAGLMLLFPSYFYHRTIPFAGDGLRVSIAFDVMPTGNGVQDAGQDRRLSQDEAGAEAGRIHELLRAGEVAEARERAENLVQANPKNPAALYLAGIASYRSGNVKKAQGYFSRACEEDPANPRYRLDHAACLQQLDRPGEAAGNLEKAAELDPGEVEAFMRLGTLYSDRGDFDGARHAYERAIARQPSHGGAHYGLASLKRFSQDDPQIDQLRKLLGDSSMEPSNEAVICFALARAMDQLEKLEEAMDLYGRANRIKRELTDFDMEAERSNVGRIIRAFGPDVFEQFSGGGDPSDLPVFVIGMPRSGTTLVEQILDSHPGIHGAGELNDLWRVVNGIGRKLPPGVSRVSRRARRALCRPAGTPGRLPGRR